MDQGSLVRTVAQSQVHGRGGGRCRQQDAVWLSAQLGGFDRERAENRCCGQFNELGKIRALGTKPVPKAWISAISNGLGDRMRNLMKRISCTGKSITVLGSVCRSTRFKTDSAVPLVGYSRDHRSRKVQRPSGSRREKTDWEVDQTIDRKGSPQIQEKNATRLIGAQPFEAVAGRSLLIAIDQGGGRAFDGSVVPDMGTAFGDKVQVGESLQSSERRILSVSAKPMGRIRAGFCISTPPATAA